MSNDVPRFQTFEINSTFYGMTISYALCYMLEFSFETDVANLQLAKAYVFDVFQFLSEYTSSF